MNQMAEENDSIALILGITWGTREWILKIEDWLFEDQVKFYDKTLPSNNIIMIIDVCFFQ